MAKKDDGGKDLKFDKQDFDLFGALDAIDRKDYGWWDKLSEEQQRKFVPYMLLHWVSTVKVGGVVGSYYVLSTDSAANKHMFNEYVAKHPKLQWLMFCTASPGLGKQWHQWIPHLPASIGQLKAAAKKREVADYFSKVYKGASQDDISLAAEEYTASQNHKYRLAAMHPELKLTDLEVLAGLVTGSELDEYERQAGN